ncbi:MAG: T9SS type A sorting domain-containing protein [Bacteroidetes bacterium]|nr:T9SS type A sorting domain-containing protein [Bacteroidota bacterium]
MIKKLLSIALVAVGVKTINAQSFSLYYPFTSVQGTVALITTDPTPAPVATGVTSGSFTAVGTGTGSTTNGVFSFVGWGTGATTGNNTTFTGAIDLNKYYQITLTPQANYIVTLNSMSFGATRSGTGVRHWAVRTNKDAYTANVAATYTAYSSAASSTPQPISVQGGNTFFWNDDAVINPAAFATYNMCGVTFGANCANQFTPFNIRMYAWDAEAATGTFRIDTLTINGIATMSLGVGLPTISHDINAKIKLYPNPNTDGIVIVEPATTDYSKIEVVNILGAVVASQNNALAEEKIRLDLTSLPIGTYFVKITSGDKVYTEKLIIAK